MNPELAMIRAKVAEKKQRFTELQLKSANLIMLLRRDLLVTWVECTTELKTDQIVQASNELHETAEEMRTLKAQINKLEEDLK